MPVSAITAILNFSVESLRHYVINVVSGCETGDVVETHVSGDTLVETHVGGDTLVETHVGGDTLVETHVSGDTRPINAMLKSGGGLQSVLTKQKILIYEKFTH